MKVLTIIALLFLTFTSHSQTVIHKPVMILKISGGVRPIEFKRVIIESDTIYRLVFQNWQYQHLTDIKSLNLEKKELPAFAKALKAAEAAAMDDKVMMPDYSIEKLRAGLMGATHYWLHHDRGYCQLSEKDLKKLTEVVEKE